MKKSRTLTILGIAVLLLAVAKAGIWYYGNTIIHEGATYQITLIDDAPYQVPLETQINFTATLLLGSEPVSNVWIYLLVNGTTYSTAPTNQNGQAYFTFIMPDTNIYIFQPAYEAP